jgi:1-acyl-sn-glycerol-3-phosphate acyltransferase
MIRPQKNIVIRWVLHNYVRWIVGRHFHEVLFDKVEVDESRSILLLANHFSFWDSLILYIICRKQLKKRFYVLVREDTTAQLRYLKYGGAFSINKKSRDMLQSLDYAAELLNDPKNLVLIFPQGKLYSNFVQDIHFEKGIRRVMEKAQGNFKLIFATTFIQYLKHKKQTATVYLKAENDSDGDFEKLKNAYQQYYNETKLQQTEIVI